MDRWITVALVSSALLVAAGSGVAAESPRPNVLVIMVDDLGYSDLGCYGGEIRTPNLDALAAQGLRFTQFYNAARCWPTRGALLTGYYAQSIRRDAAEAAAGQPPIAVGARPAWARLLPQLLKPHGYRTYHAGKWHVDGSSQAGGFDRSYRLEDTDRYFGPQKHFEDDQPLAQPARDSGFYATTAIADHAIEYLQDHAAHHADEPFFEYVAFISPHFPLQAPPDDVAKYRDAYRSGWDDIRAQRWQRLQLLGTIAGPLSPVDRHLPPAHASAGVLEGMGPGEVDRAAPWAELTQQQRELQAGKMAVYAAMVDRMDQEIGRILDQVRSMDAQDDTLVIFLSDNGASSELFIRGDGHDPAAPLGSAKTFICEGPGWASVSNTPFRKHKCWVHEGGISTPLIVRWPDGIAARGEFRTTPGHVVDVVPTVLEVAAGAAAVATAEGAPPRPGVSLVPNFARDGAAPHDRLWWLHEGNRALRRGDWKLVAVKGQPWELYDLATDRTETNDVAKSRPELVEELEQAWQVELEEVRRLASDRLR